MNTDIIDISVFKPDSLTIAPETTQEQWQEIHRTILLCRKSSRSWLKQSREFASEQWGVDYVASAEIQMELALGLPEPKERPQLNPEDKTSAIITIEGIVQNFMMWHRKMDKEIATWDAGRLRKALSLLEPIETEARRIRELLGQQGASSTQGDTPHKESLQS
tara:strand:- start:21 stop:509 length:489 start_codon:yes stop_codon:yes gene_type:complete